VLNGLNLLPIAAYFVPLPAQLVAGVLPTYWPMRALWSATAGDAYLHFVAAGAVAGIGAISVAARLFELRLRARA
jgi:fluoroquinolone transport system permease protein